MLQVDTMRVSVTPLPEVAGRASLRQSLPHQVGQEVVPTRVLRRQPRRRLVHQDLFTREEALRPVVEPPVVAQLRLQQHREEHRLRRRDYRRRR